MFSGDFRNFCQLSNLMHFRPVGDELLHVDRQRGTTNLKVAFHNFENAIINAITNTVFSKLN
jgi:hypothetical protein